LSKSRPNQFRTHVYRTLRTIRKIESLKKLESGGWSKSYLDSIRLLEQMDRDIAFKYVRFLFLESEDTSWAIMAMGYLGDSRAVDLLLSFVYRPHYVFHYGKGIKMGPTGWISTPVYSFSESKSVLAYAIETIGRIGDERGVTALAVDGLGQRLQPFRSPFLMCWTLASIASKTEDLAIKRQSVLQMLVLFPDLQPILFGDIGMHQMPWLEQEMIPYIATLLEDIDPHVRLRAAWFLGKHGNTEGAGLLYNALQNLPDAMDLPNFNQQNWTNALASTDDRRLVEFYLDLFDRPEPPRYAAENLYLVLDRWGKTLTQEERTRFTQAVPYVLSLLPKGELIELPMPEAQIIQSINSIGSEESKALLNEWLSSELSLLFAPYIERGTDALNKHFINKVEKLIIRHFGATQKTEVLNHPLVRRYAFRILRERYEFLRACEEQHSDLDWIIAHIGWLHDPQAIPFLEAEFNRLLAALPRKYEWNDGRLSSAEEVFVAILNIGTRETIPFFLKAFDYSDWLFNRIVGMDAIRNYVGNMPDQRVIEAIFNYIETHADYYNTEIISAIGHTGSADAIPALLRLLSHMPTYYRDYGEIITALVRIAKANLDNANLVVSVLSALSPLLDVRDIIPLSGLFHPVETIRVDQHTVYALQVIGTPQAQALIHKWQTQNSQ